FQLAMDDTQKLDENFILTLHQLAVSNVANTNYDKNPKAIMGGFKDVMTYGLSPNNTTPKGIEAILQSPHDDLFIGIELAERSHSYFQINNKLIEKLSTTSLDNINLK